MHPINSGHPGELSPSLQHCNDEDDEKKEELNLNYNPHHPPISSNIIGYNHSPHQPLLKSSKNIMSYNSLMDTAFEPSQSGDSRHEGRNRNYNAIGNHVVMINQHYHNHGISNNVKNCCLWVCIYLAGVITGVAIMSGYCHGNN